jgi:hypothetical protein
MLREGLLFSSKDFKDEEEHWLRFMWTRYLADLSFTDICALHGMSETMQNIVFWAVDTFGEKHALPQELKH